MMADKLLIIMVNTDPNNGAELGAPFFQATVAAAMEYDVEVILTGRSGELAIRGVAEKLFIKPDSKQTVYDYIQEAYEAGVKFKVCTPTLDLWGDDLIPEITETIGGAYIISEAMDDNTVTFTY
jgi:predicted peroxiredoxin